MTLLRALPSVPECHPAVRWVVLACLSAAFLLGSRYSHAAEPVPAPDFALRSSSGQNLRLSEFRGEVVVVSFWASWCGPCQQQITRLNELHDRYNKTGLVLLGVNVDDDQGRAAEMLRSLRVAFPTLFDEHKEVARLYALDAMPTTIFIDREGRIRDVRETYQPEDEAGYLETIRTLLDE